MEDNHSPQPAFSGLQSKPAWIHWRIFAVCVLLSLGARISAAELYLRANQVGYRPDDVKIAVAFSTNPLPAAFSVLEEDTRKMVFQGRLQPVTNVKWGRFDNHAELDFSGVTRPGRYYVTVGSDRSLPFSVSADAFRGLPDELLEFIRQQRCGYNPFLDVLCHSTDGRALGGPLTNGAFAETTGGWHDSADYSKYLLIAGNATAQMLLAYKLAPICFQDRFNALGQSGTNGIPDVLDEARWGLAWMLKLHPAANQLFDQVGDYRGSPSARLPQNDSVDYGWGAGSYRPIYSTGSSPQTGETNFPGTRGFANLAGRYAAAMALAFQIWKDDPRESPFGAACLQAGIEVYQLGKSHEGAQQNVAANPFSHYLETTWADDMEWGAAELYHATHKRQYLDDARHYAELSAADSWMGREQFGYYQFYPFVNLGHFALWDSAPRSLRPQLAAYYRQGIEASLSLAQKNPYRIGVPFVRASNALAVALATQIILYERMTGDLRYHAFLADQRDWLLGRNPWGTSMFSGLPSGGIYPHDIFLPVAKLTKRPVRGGLISGPVDNRTFWSIKGITVPTPDPLEMFQDDRAVYHDEAGDFVTNEPTLDGTASAILLWALCGLEK